METNRNESADEGDHHAPSPDQRRQEGVGDMNASAEGESVDGTPIMRSDVRHTGAVYTISGAVGGQRDARIKAEIRRRRAADGGRRRVERRRLR